MSGETEQQNRRMLRARDAMDRQFADSLDIPTLARIAHVSEAHFIRTFRATFAETPHRYLQRRRVERAMAMLCSTDRSITDICMSVGFSSLGTFSRTFREIVGESPKDYRASHPLVAEVPTHFSMAWTRPSSFGEGRQPREPLRRRLCSPVSTCLRSSSSTRTRRWTSTSASSASRCTPTSTSASCAG